MKKTRSPLIASLVLSLSACGGATDELLQMPDGNDSEESSDDADGKSPEDEEVPQDEDLPDDDFPELLGGTGGQESGDPDDESLGGSGGSTPNECDQTIEVQPGPLNGQDATIMSLLRSDVDYTNRNWSDINALRVAQWTGGGYPNTVRSLLKFDLPEAPEGSKLQAAELLFFATTEGSFDPDGAAHSQLSHENSWSVHRIDSEWQHDTVTWNSQPTTADELHLPAISGNQNGLVNVTEWTRQQLYGDLANHGYLIRLQAEQHYSSVNFASSDHDDAALRPKLVLTFECR